MDPHFHDDPDNMDGQEEWGEDDSLDGAGANSLPASVWAHQWSQTSAARQQEKEEMEEEEGLAEKAVVQKDKETRPVYEEEKAGSGRKANAGDAGLRRRLGRLIKTPGPIGSDDEAGGTGGGKPHGGGGDGGRGDQQQLQRPQERETLQEADEDVVQLAGGCGGFRAACLLTRPTQSGHVSHDHTVFQTRSVKPLVSSPPLSPLAWSFRRCW